MDKLEELLKTRAQVEVELEKLRTPITILFSDIKGSTSFFEAQGDVEGLAMVHRHNSVLFPLIEQNHGRVVKTIGDAIMAAFDKPENALRAGIAMQQALARHNQDRGPGQGIHIRIGIHTGLGLIKGGDVYGDVVNTASRVEHQSEPDQIFISEDLLAPAGALGVNAVSAGAAELKGKAETVQLYKLDWQAYTLSSPPGASVQRQKMTSSGIAAAVVVLIVAAVSASVWLREEAPPGIQSALIENSEVKGPAPEKTSVTALEVSELLVQSSAARAILEKAGKPATRDALLLDGALRGLRGDAGESPITRAELAFVLEDLLALATGNDRLSTQHIGAESSPFLDVEPSHPAFNAIMTVTTHNLLRARTSDRFAPAEPASPSEVRSALDGFEKTVNR